MVDSDVSGRAAPDHHPHPTLPHSVLSHILLWLCTSQRSCVLSLLFAS